MHEGHAFAAAISACAAGGDWQGACSLFEEMIKHSIQPDVVSCTALISALATGGQWQQSEQVVSWMLQAGVRPNVRTYTALLNSLGQARQWQRAVVLLRRMGESEFGGVEPNAYCYSALLKSLGEHGQWEIAEQVFSELENEALGARGLLPNVDSNPQAVLNSTGHQANLPSSICQTFASSPDSASTVDNSIWANVVDIIGLSSQQVAQALQGHLDESVLGMNHINSSGSTDARGIATPGFSHTGSTDDTSNFSTTQGNLQFVRGADNHSTSRKPQPRVRHSKVNEVVCGALMMAYSKAGKVGTSLKSVIS